MISASDEQLVTERCTKLSGSGWVDILVGYYYDDNPDTEVNIVECNRIKQVVSQPDYIRLVAINQLRNEGLIPTPSN